jgi:hypothetical protein
LIKEIEPYYFPKKQLWQRQAKGGRPAFDLELMLKILCLQQWF